MGLGQKLRFDKVPDRARECYVAYAFCLDSCCRAWELRSGSCNDELECKVRAMRLCKMKCLQGKQRSLSPASIAQETAA